MVSNRPTTAMIQELLQKELQQRAGRLPLEMCQQVLRFGGFVGSELSCHEHLPRAMDYARDHISQVEQRSGSVANGTVILADTMSRSKGRFTREWHAPSGGIWGCLIHANTLLDHSKRLLTLAIGLACCETIHDLGGEHAAVRWVNDVLFQEKKVAGFLVETATGSVFGEEYHLVGFGINVNNTDFPPELSSIATSLSQQLGQNFDLASVTARFLVKLIWNFGLLYYEEAQELRGEGYSGVNGKHLLLEHWLNCSDSIGQDVWFGFDVIEAPQYQARVVGLGDDGGLHLRFSDGSEKVEYSGEIRYVKRG